jgi:hypothetical protein
MKASLSMGTLHGGVRRIIAATGVGTRFIASQAGWGGLAHVDLVGHSASRWCDPTTPPCGTR